MSKFSANRVVLILHGIFIAAMCVTIFVTTISGNLPKAWQPDIALGLSLTTAIAGGTVAVTKFLNGSQNFDTNQAQIRAQELALEQEKIAHARALIEAGQTSEFTDPTQASGDGSNQTEVTSSSEFGDLNPDYAPDHTGAPEVEITNEIPAPTPEGSTG